MIEAELKKVRYFVTAANILVIISIFFMGIPLGLIAIICALIAHSKFKKLSTTNKLDGNLEDFYSKKIMMVLILTFVIFALNCFSAYTMYPYYSEMISQYFGQSGAISSGVSELNNGSIWG